MGMNALLEVVAKSCLLRLSTLYLSIYYRCVLLPARLILVVRFYVQGYDFTCWNLQQLFL
ncbi:hypothetical protein KDAU_40200 [Dictyobacter aurantiacus]|uniref:Uncharacterized protein n=1 Tax=Dictyobacter aurantiacus TaxID=1936993 RepID=A0A401ZIK4_9CHLR|nr:hypothetical protein KDAU_40200 [Dictyobacter aurantiacus]